MKSDAEVIGLIRGGTRVNWDAPAALNEMPITLPYSRGAAIYNGTLAGCVNLCMSLKPQPMVMYTIFFEAGTIEGLDRGTIMQQVIVELASRKDCPRVA